ncbi:CCA tRNA nucleotidyltransferase [bacterium]|nr:CCA tRNA nucleotidyltransferase [bacterium]MBU1650988.1 CCA tRNA nucleotidyltransferase [bacterium]MBU1880595.1 CCA tRNA nucleotidyltransferase [bacterium]
MLLTDTTINPRDDAVYQQAADVVLQIQNKGFEAFFVGGCVRDLLLKLTPKDYDVATDAKPEDIKAIFPDAKGAGKRFGVSIVTTTAGEFEIAAFRQDGEYFDHRRPAWVDFSGIEADTLRRDFTINALYFDPIKREFVDLIGGRKDLERRTLRVIGDPYERLDEDWLRILRAIRFAARFALRFDPRTWEAVRSLAPFVSGIVPERCTEELRLMLTGPHSGRAVGLLHKSGIWYALWPEIPFDAKRLRKSVMFLQHDKIPPASVWVALFAGLSEAQVTRAAEGLCLTKPEKKALSRK